MKTPTFACADPPCLAALEERSVSPGLRLAEGDGSREAVLDNEPAVLVMSEAGPLGRQSWADSSSRRCCGSIRAASAAATPNRLASNSSTPAPETHHHHSVQCISLTCPSADRNFNCCLPLLWPKVPLP